MRVLIVDDDAWFAESLKGCLSGFEVGIITAADDIFPAIEQFRPDILLLDLILSEQNAITFLNEFASYDDLQTLRIFVLSSAAKDFDAKTLTDFGVEKVFDKADFTPQILEAAI
ncbi:MAG: response regulator [Candidatus Nomurabacteria bacterium]|jgi:two-component system alkaline phosphatase synthesis response regulator PhoP|nr:response regulator [Candidatus Nomurabacteria bacterium]